ncbi:flagellar basal body-associated protein FliL [Malonomonas rubra]|uniref:flagellar basal body-associated FliL family protein n=1 Tax=Malonomonas rubra TaxID=57040 RepID=UPI0026EF0B84|nr:flagellar basal body-associated FliL family protein [Malonomonas rubra]
MAKKDAAEQADTGGSKNKLSIIIVAVVLLLIGVGVGVFMFLGGEDKKIFPEQEQAEFAKQSRQVGPMVNIDTFIVNIIDDEESRYLKAAITLEMNTPTAAAEVSERMPQIKDAILLLVGNKTFPELQDLQGKIQLRAELINRINSVLANGKVKRIYFTDFVVQ